MSDTENLPAPPKQPKAELVAGQHVAPIIPRTIDEVARIANAVIVAGLAPNSYEGRTPQETASKIMIGIMKGAEIGLAPLTALANIAIINGRASLWGDGAVALIQASGKVSKWAETFEGEEGQDNYTAVCTIWRVNQEEPYVGKFSIGDAKRAGLWNNPRKQPWVQYGSRMQMWRARSYAMRTGFADCVSGLSIAEEAQDIPAAPQPVNTDFLQDEPVAAISGPVDAAPPEAPPANVTNPPEVQSEPLVRGLRILGTLTKETDIRDLEKTISEELETDTERLKWQLECSLKLGEGK